MIVSILTPTYNRAYTLTRLYNSICSQKDVQCNSVFEWVIIDDGSVDETGQLVQQFLSEKKINIKYYYQNNSGKPTAINHGVAKSMAKYIFIVDSDDALTSDAISTIIEMDKVTREDCSDNSLSGLCFRRADFSGNIMGLLQSDFPDYTDMLATQAGKKFKADLAYVFKRELLELNPFPKIGNEKFVPELFIWNKITDVNLTRFFYKKAIYLCDYLDDGLTRNFKQQLKNNPLGFFIYYSDQYHRETKITNKIKMLLRSLQCYIYAMTSEK